MPTYNVSGTPNGFLGSQNARVIRDTYTSGAAYITTSVGPIRNNSVVDVYPLATATGANYEGICEIYANRSTSQSNGTIRTGPIYGVPQSTDFLFEIVVREP